MVNKTSRKWGKGFGPNSRIMLLEARVEALEQELLEYRVKEITHQRAS